jgi:hypothetical protein
MAQFSVEHFLSGLLNITKFGLAKQNDKCLTVTLLMLRFITKLSILSAANWKLLGIIYDW